MELPKDLVSRLLADGRGRPCLVKALLLLDPEDLKACRLVCSAWNEFIEEEVWSSQAGRSILTKKLVKRWKTTNPETVQLGTVPRGVRAMFCNNSHVFLGWLQGGKVKVYSLADGQWARDLESVDENLWVERICGSESIVAAWLGDHVVTVWTSKEEMGRLHSFDVRNLDGFDGCWVDDIKVSGNKVVLLLRKGRSSTHQLVVLQEGEHNWENKILEPFAMEIRGRLAVDKDWWAVTGRKESRSDILKVKLWKEDLFRQDIELPGVSADDVADLVLESPLLVVAGTSWSGDRVTVWIFQLAADNLMEDLNSAASLVKTVQFPGFYAHKLLCTQLVWGCLMVAQGQDNHGFSLVLFEKTALLDAATLPEQTPRNRVHLEATEDYLVDMNTTSFVFIQESESESESSPGRDGKEQNYLCKKDFWMSGSTIG